MVSPDYRDRETAEGYEADRFGGRFGEYLRDHEVELFLCHLEGCDGPVLDLGSGTGKISLPLLERNRSVISADISLEMLSVARRACQKRDLRLRPVVIDAQQLCFRDRAFTAVASSRTLMHVADWQRCLGEVCRVTRERIIVDFPARLSVASIDSSARRLGARLGRPARTYKTLATHELAREIQRLGFTAIVVEKQFLLPIAFHRKLDRVHTTLRLEQFCRRLGLTRLFGSPVTLVAVRGSSQLP